MQPNVRAVREEDIASLTARLRAYDLRVLRDYTDHPDVPGLLALSVKLTAQTVAVEDASGVIAIIGVADDPADPTIGLPWIAATDDLPRISIWLLRNIRRVLAELSGGRHRLHRGELPADARTFTRFVQWCGYALSDEITTPMGATYLKFEGAPQCLGSCHSSRPSSAQSASASP